MTFVAKNFEYLIGMSGFSEKMLRDHFVLYQGYVDRANQIQRALITLRHERPSISEVPSEIQELHRRFSWEYNGMRLHELYFENLTPKKTGGVTGLPRAVANKFGSLKRWIEDFQEVGATRGFGWVITYFDPSANDIYNIWVDEHNTGHLVGLVPLLVMDVFEHAYAQDYGIKRDEYVEAFLSNVDWEIVDQRFFKAVQQS